MGVETVTNDQPQELALTSTPGHHGRATGSPSRDRPQSDDRMCPCACRRAIKQLHGFERKRKSKNTPPSVTLADDMPDDDDTYRRASSFSLFVVLSLVCDLR
jgi:hypothetical protein